MIERDLVATPLSHLTLGGSGDDDVLDEFLAADTVVVGAPMYNFTVPSQLKAWIDRILVAGKTFRYGANGPEGLAGGKRVIVALSRGGFYEDNSAFEHAKSYLQAAFGFIGITPGIRHRRRHCGRARTARSGHRQRAGRGRAARGLTLLATGRMTMTNSLERNQPVALGILRIMSGLLFLAHGTQKFLSFPGGERAGSGLALDNPGAYAGLIELVTGLLIALGLFTRPAAFLASGTMAAAYFIGHAPQDFWPVNNMGDAAILYCFVFLYLVFAGPGRFSLDSQYSRRALAE